jgi:SAM-dependent methyltransferase
MKASRLALYHETYDARALCDARLIGDHAPHYVRLANRFGGPVLELGAGTGRISKAIARAGGDATALEISDEMIAAGSLAGDPAPAGFRWLRADARRIPADRTYRFVMAPFRMLQELPGEEDVLQVLASVLNVLAEDGIFCFDMVDIDGMPSLKRSDRTTQRMEDVVHPVTGGTVRVHACERIAEPATRRYRERWRFDLIGPGGRVARSDEYWQAHRWYTRRDVAAMLSHVGYRGALWYGQFEDIAASRPRQPGRDQIWLCQRNL